MRRISLSIVPLVLFASACHQEFLPERGALSLKEESGEALESVPQVSRFRLSGAGQLELADVWLVSGDVSSVSQGKLERGEIPQTVEEHREPLIAWVEREDVVLAPCKVLEPGARYSFVALGLGLIATFAVSTEERPVLHRWGPPVATEGGEAIYCAGPPPLLSVPVALEAFDDAEGFGQGLSDDGVGVDFCVRAKLPTGESLFVPPPSVDEFLIEPAPIDLLPPVAVDSLDRTPSGCDELPGFRGGCAEVAQGALLVHVLPGYYFLSFFPEGAANSAQSLVLQADVDETHAFGPLLADTNYKLEVTRFVPGGITFTPESETLEFESGSPAPRFILTEVLADPLGSEPQAEWVEVMNTGTSSGSLGGLELWDSGGGVLLPDVVFRPGELGLIVRADFSFESDEVPHPQSKPVVVPSLGENGLRNSGEEVSLRDGDGRILSAIPAISASAGESVARLDPWSSDVRASFETRRPPTPGVF